jgi:hypothetical protein
MKRIALLLLMILAASSAVGQIVQNPDLRVITRTDGVIPVGDGTKFVGESGATLRASIGLNMLIDATNDNFTNNSADNSIATGCTQATIGGGGLAAGWGNFIGSTGKPSGTDFTPTGWADDADYVEGFADFSTISGGYDNICNQVAGVIAGGGHNFIKYDAGGHSAILAGSYNLIEADRAMIFGGAANSINGNGSYSVILGGYGNDLSAGNCLAYGRRAKVSGAGSTVLADSTDADFTISTANQFAGRFAGGYYLSGAGNVGIGVAPSSSAGLSVVAQSGDNVFLGKSSAKWSGFVLKNHADATIWNAYPNDDDGGGAIVDLSDDAAVKVRLDSDGDSYLVGGNVGIADSSPDYKLDVTGSLGIAPGNSVTPAANGDVVLELTSNNLVTVKAKGSDTTVRSVGLAMGITSGTDTDDAETIAWAASEYHTLTLDNDTGPCVLTFTDPVCAPARLILVLVQDADGGETVTWPAAETIYWAGGAVPTLATGANARDMITLLWDGTAYYCTGYGYAVAP